MALALTIGAALVCGFGWFLLAWRVMHETAGDAAGEALGVAFGILIVASVIGALRGFARKGGAGTGDSGEDPENPS